MNMQGYRGRGRGGGGGGRGVGGGRGGSFRGGRGVLRPSGRVRRARKPRHRCPEMSNLPLFLPQQSLIALYPFDAYRFG